MRTAQLRTSPALTRIKDSRGQASSEYLIAVVAILVAVLALYAAVSFFAGSDGQNDATKVIYSRAPYTLPNSNQMSEQWVKDLIIH